MRRLFLSAVALLACGLLGAPAQAQMTATVVAACGTPPNTYSAGQTRNVLQDTTGTLCTPSGGGGGTVTANQGTAGATPWLVDTPDGTASGSLTAADASSTVVTTGQGSSTIITGSPTAGSTAAIALAAGRQSVETLVTGTWSGVISFEGSSDGGTTWSLIGQHVRGGVAATTSATANGSFLANVSGLTNFRVRFTTRNSGTVVVAFVGSIAPGSVYVANPINPSSSNYSGNVPNTATAALATPGSIKGIWVGNNNSTFCYLQFWDLATGSVTVGTTAPMFSLPVPALGGGVMSVPPSVFLTAITVAATTTRAGSTACTNGIDVNLWF